jgi:hypothetical protein
MAKEHRPQPIIIRPNSPDKGNKGRTIIAPPAKPAPSKK